MTRGSAAQKTKKVKDHATREDVENGISEDRGRIGDNNADALADVCAAHAPDYVIVKTMEKYSRGGEARASYLNGTKSSSCTTIRRYSGCRQ